MLVGVDQTLLGQRREDLALEVKNGDDAIELALGELERDVDDYLEYTLDETMRRLEQ